MGVSISGKTIDCVVAAGIATWFRKATFQRKGRSFFRAHGELILTSTVQASKTNVPNDMKFAVNLGVEWPYWNHIWTGRDRKANPALAPTFVHVRLHPTLGWGRDLLALLLAAYPVTEVAQPTVSFSSIRGLSVGGRWRVASST